MSLVRYSMRNLDICLQVVAKMPRSIILTRNPQAAAAILSTGLAWAAVTLSASAADLSNGTCLYSFLPLNHIWRELCNNLHLLSADIRTIHQGFTYL